MNSLLHPLHCIAAERGDGLLPELCRRLPQMDADKLNQLNTAPEELQRRRNLALARHKRESERKALLDMLMETERRADNLRRWIAGQQLHPKAAASGELSRMLQWAGDELTALETMTALAPLAETLHRQNLFPEVDKLADPLGDPPPLQPWGR